MPAAKGGDGEKVAPVFLSQEQTHILRLVESGQSLFYTGSAGKCLSLHISEPCPGHAGIFLYICAHICRFRDPCLFLDLGSPMSKLQVQGSRFCYGKSSRHSRRDTLSLPMLSQSLLLQVICFGFETTWRFVDTVVVGIAACNVGGVTIHSFAGIGIGADTREALLTRVKKNKKAMTRWLRTRVLIIDEGMLHLVDSPPILTSVS